jgi:hypothetical protein
MFVLRGAQGNMLWLRAFLVALEAQSVLKRFLQLESHVFWKQCIVCGCSSDTLLGSYIDAATAPSSI